jgi:hypothetical protein
MEASSRDSGREGADASIQGIFLLLQNVSLSQMNAREKDIMTNGETGQG